MPIKHVADPALLLGSAVPLFVKYLTLAFAVAVLGMLVLIVAVYFETNARRRKVAALRSQWRGHILRFIVEDDSEPAADLIAATRKEPLRFLQLLMTFGNLLQGGNTENVVRLITATPLLKWMRKVASRRNDYRFPEVARATALFRLQDLREQMLMHIRSPKDINQLSAAYAVARLANPDDIDELSKAISEFAETRRDLAFVILAAFAEQRADKFIEFLKDHLGEDDAVHLLALDVAGSLNLTNAGDVLVAELKDARTPASLTAAILAAGRARIVDAHEAFHVHLIHPDENVRGAAAWALGRLRDAGDATTLANLLEDRSWTVRLNAASALVELDAVGVEALRHVRDTTTDRFARDMAQRALTYHELGVPIV